MAGPTTRTPETMRVEEPPRAESARTESARPAAAIEPGGEWARILDAAMSYRRLRMVLGDSRLVEVKGGRVVIEVPASLGAVAKANERELVAVVASALGRSLEVDLIEAKAPEAEAVATEPAAARTPVEQEPLVRQALDLFGARIVSVTPRPTPKG